MFFKISILAFNTITVFLVVLSMGSELFVSSFSSLRFLDLRSFAKRPILTAKAPPFCY